MIQCFTENQFLLCIQFILIMFSTGADVKTNTLLQNIDISGSKAVARGRHGDDDVACSADVIIITMPVPQILNLKGITLF